MVAVWGTWKQESLRRLRAPAHSNRSAGSCGNAESGPITAAITPGVAPGTPHRLVAAGHRALRGLGRAIKIWGPAWQWGQGIMDTTLVPEAATPWQTRQLLKRIRSWWQFQGLIYIVAFPCIQVGSSGLVGYVCAEFQWANMWSRWSLCDIELQILFLFFLFLIKSTNKIIFFPGIYC